MLKIITKGILNTAAAQLLSLMFVFMSVIFLKSTAVKIFVGIAAFFIICGMTVNYSYNIAVKEKGMIKNGKIKADFFHLFLPAFSVSFIPVLLWSVLVISSMEIIPDIWPYYKLLNEYFFIFCEFSCKSASASELGAGALVTLFTVSLIPGAVSVLTYIFTLKKS